MRIFLGAILVTTAITLIGCSSSDDGDETKGSPPTIANLALSTQTIAVGKVEVVRGTVDFDDPDSDFDAIEGSLVFAGQTQAVPRQTATTNGQKSGTLNLAFQIGAAQAGTAEIEIWGLDKNGNKSNRQKVSVEAK